MAEILDGAENPKGEEDFEQETIRIPYAIDSYEEIGDIQPGPEEHTDVIKRILPRVGWFITLNQD